jgi:general transcription factor 3C polypeptide 5 (transcription factor C subunit 1)
LNPPLKATDAPIQLFLRPDDPLSRPLKSTNTASNNVLLKVTVPKRTGRKRKRGSNEPFQDAPVETIAESVPRPTAKNLLRSLRDNESKYQIKPIGKVERTHVFRGTF